MPGSKLQQPWSPCGFKVWVEARLGLFPRWIGANSNSNRTITRLSVFRARCAGDGSLTLTLALHPEPFLLDVHPPATPGSSHQIAPDPALTTRLFYVYFVLPSHTCARLTKPLLLGCTSLPFSSSHILSTFLLVRAGLFSSPSLSGIS